jgi:hypothetical protein
MWSAIATIAIGFPLLLWSLGMNNAFRTKAEKAKWSIPYYFIQAFDAACSWSIFRPILAPHATPRKADRVRKTPDASGIQARFNLHDFANIDEMISIRSSTTISIDLSKKMPRIWRNWLLNPWLAGIILLSVGFLLGIAWIPIGINYLSQGEFFALQMITTFLPLAVTIGPSVIFGDWSRFTMFALYFNPVILVVIDEQLVIINSVFSSCGVNNTGAPVFFPLEEEFQKGIYVPDGKNGRVLVVSYPRLLAEVIFDDIEIRNICKNLNALISRAKVHPVAGYELSRNVS